MDWLDSESIYPLRKIKLINGYARVSKNNNQNKIKSTDLPPPETHTLPLNLDGPSQDTFLLSYQYPYSSIL